MKEKEWLHIGNATVYLRGWVNIDVRGSGSSLAAVCPRGVEKWGTTETAYYHRLPETTQQLVIAGEPPDHALMVCDRYGTWEDIPCFDGNASRILSRQVFEHLSMTEARLAMREAFRVLEPGGLLELDVPDIPTTLELYRETGDLFLKRHILGSRKNDFSYHCVGWTMDGLNAFVAGYGFDFVGWQPNIHFYPAFSGVWRRK